MISVLQLPTGERICKVLWAATLLTLPVTSFRYFPAGEGTFVRPLAFFPLALLVLVLLFRMLLGGLAAPRAGALTPLGALLLFLLVASMVGLLLAPIPLHGQLVAGRVLRAWISLGIGLAFFVAAIWMNRNVEDIRFSVRWLFAGFLIDVLWSGLQAATFYLHLLPKPLVTQWQRAFSLRELIRTNRISGMAYEPAWLAGQMATVYLPWLLAALLTRVRLTRLRWMEPAGAVAALALVVATFSRGGMLTAAVSVGGTLLLVGRAELMSTWNWFVSGFRRRQTLLSRIAISTGALAAIAGISVLLAQKGYISNLWNSQVSDLADFLIENSAGARGAYLSSAMQTFEDHPWTGVGLGASGFYMYDRLPDWALTTVPEIARQLSPESSLFPNPKNLYVRLLAETGILGILLYVAFQFALLADILSALRQDMPMFRYLGIAGLASWLALLVYNISQDSFATPNLWINLGILAGVMTREAARLQRQDWRGRARSPARARGKLAAARELE